MRWIILIILLLVGCEAATVNEQGPSLRLLLCTQDNCERALSALIRNSTQVVCALYSLRSDAIADALAQVNARVVLDHGSLPGSRVVTGYAEEGLMHNKFCVLDNVVWTGSWNLASRTHTANNAVVIPSQHLAMVFREEFEELWSGELRAGARTKAPHANLSGVRVSAYFCPEDYCAKRLLAEIGRAEKSVHFMTYSFTDKDVAMAMLAKAAQGVDVRGVLDKSQARGYSVKDMLVNHSMIRKNVHHKVFIIDNKTVITGSYNPSISGNTRNDENMLIIRSVNVARVLEEEMERLQHSSQNST